MQKDAPMRLAGKHSRALAEKLASNAATSEVEKAKLICQFFCKPEGRDLAQYQYLAHVAQDCGRSSLSSGRYWEGTQGPLSLPRQGHPPAVTHPPLPEME